MIRPYVLLAPLAAGCILAGTATARPGPTWHLLAQNDSVSPPGPPGLTAVTAETAIPAASGHRVLQIRVVATPANLRPYVSWRVACPSGRPSSRGDGFHRATFTKTITSASGCAADVTATLYFWAGASGVRVSIYGS
jgi:hypothetical protein